MFPYHDENETQRTPIVTMAFVAMSTLAWLVVQGTPEAFTNFIKAETAKFAPVIKRTGVQVD